MKIIALGDTHGRTYWKTIVKRQSYDYLIFIGDYFDVKKYVSPKIQISNFSSICEYKKANLNKVIMLLGNHDYHYLDGVNEIYSGFQLKHYDAISEALHSSLDAGLIQLCFDYENILFTHAGVTKTWCEENNVNTKDVTKSINDLFINNPECFSHSHSQTVVKALGISPIWVRPEYLLSDKLEHYIQVVGHTMQESIKAINNVVFIDTLGTSKEYLIIEDGKFLVGKI